MRGGDLRIERIAAHLKQAEALIFDVDGTLAETEEVHRMAFNEAFALGGLGWSWNQAAYKWLLQTTGGKERIRAFEKMRERGCDELSQTEVDNLHRIKTRIYGETIARGGCPLRPGVMATIRMAQRRGQRLAIATTTSHENIGALLTGTLGAGWQDVFEVVVAGDDVPYKKPAPDVYLEVLRRLQLPAVACVAIEDSVNGLRSATLAGVPVIITKSQYFQDENFGGALGVIETLDELYREIGDT